MLCERLNNTERALYHFKQNRPLSPSISGQEFDLQIQIQNTIDKKMIIENGLLTEIENSEFKLFKFSAYILMLQ